MRSLGLLVAVLGATLVAAPAFADTPGIAGELEQSTTTSPKEKVEFADAAVSEIDAAVKTVEKLLDQAQKDKNVEHIECLTRKLTPMRALHEVSQQSSNTMRLALAGNDAAHADQEFRKVAVALTKAREFLAEAQACVGDTGAQHGESSATVTDNTDSLVDESSVEGALDLGELTPEASPH
jgi:hypothetical protein